MYSSSLGSSLLCLTQSLCMHVCISVHWDTAVKKRSPNPFHLFEKQDSIEWREKENEVRYFQQNYDWCKISVCSYSCLEDCLGWNCTSNLLVPQVFLHKAVLKKSRSITLRNWEEISAQFHLDLWAFFPQTCADKGDFRFLCTYRWICAKPERLSLAKINLATLADT